MQPVNDAFKELDDGRRVALALAVAEACLTALEGDANVVSLGREALDVAWRVAEGDNVDGADVARYVDGVPPEKDFGILEANYPESPKCSAVVAISLAIGFAARLAYERAGRHDWSAIIAETDHRFMHVIWRFARECGCLDERKVSAQVNALRKPSVINRRALLETDARDDVATGGAWTMTISYQGPSGEDDPPTLETLEHLIVDLPAEYWNKGSGNVIIWHNSGSELIVMPNLEHGIYLRYYAHPKDTDDVWLSLEDRTALEKTVECSDEWYASVGLFLRPDRAWLVVKEFYETGRKTDGVEWIRPIELPDEGNW